MRDIQQVLERWGAWAASEGGNVYYKPVAAGFKELLPTSGRLRTSCCDDDGLVISSAMSVLKKKDSHLYMLLEWYYVNDMTLRGITAKLGISLNQVVIRLQKAEGFIEGYLAALSVTLEMDRYIQREAPATELTREKK